MYCHRLKIKENAGWYQLHNETGIFNDMQIKTDYIKTTKLKKPLKNYHNYWNNILRLISNDNITINVIV